jgi:hypothetical protein
MDWNAIGAMGELAGALGVILSLIYLASQIRQNTLSNRIAAKQNTTNQFVRFTEQFIRDRDLMEIWDRTRASAPDISPEELRIDHYLNRQLSWYYSAQWYQYVSGAIDEDDWWESLFLIRNSWINHPGFQSWWARYRAGANPGFRAFIDGEITKQEQGSGSNSTARSQPSD